MDEDRQAEIHKALLRNEHISGVFRDALKAPFGSTKREKARKMATVLQKTLSRYDGQGGPGFSASSPGNAMPVAEPMRYDPIMHSMVIFKAPPAPAPVAPPMPVPGQPDGQGGPGDLSSLSFGQAGGLGGFTLMPQAAAPVVGNAGRSSLLTGMPQPSPFSVPNSAPQSAYASPKNPTALNITNPTAPSNFNYGQQPQQNNSFLGQFPNLSPKPLAPAPQPAQQSQPAQGGQQGGVTMGANPAPQIPWGGNGTGSGAAADQSSGYTAGGTGPAAPDAGTVTDALNRAVQAGTGPSTFAYSTMGDINALRELFPGVPDDQLPVGASLSGQIDQLRGALRSEYHIDDLTNTLSQKIQDGVHLEGDLKDYVRGKDQYLNEVDHMLTSAKRSALDKSGGPDAGIYNDYVNYLTILKGRQNKRYVDFYNDSINVYQKELDSLQNQLQTQTNAYTQELQTRSTLKQDDYNRIFTSLTEMYNAAEAAPQKQLELQVMQAELAKTLQDLAGSGQSGISKDWLAEYGALKNQDLYIGKDTGALKPDVNSLEPVLESIVSNGKTDVGGAFRIMSEAMANDIGSAGGDLGSYFSKIQKYEKMVADLKTQAADPSIQSKYGYDIGPAVDNLSATLSNKAASAVSGYVKDNASMMKGVMGDLTKGKGWFGLGGGPPDRQGFINKHKGKNLPDALLGRLYDYYTTIKGADPSGETMKALVKLPDDQFATAISQGLGASFFTSTLNQ